MVRASTPPLPPQGGDPRQVAQRVNALLRGKVNSLSAVTLTPSATTTVVTDPNIGAQSFLIPAAKTASAAAALANLHQAVTGPEEITLTHASSAATDQTFDLLIVG